MKHVSGVSYINMSQNAFLFVLCYCHQVAEADFVIKLPQDQRQDDRNT